MELMCCKHGMWMWRVIINQQSSTILNEVTQPLRLHLHDQMMMMIHPLFSPTLTPTPSLHAIK